MNSISPRPLALRLGAELAIIIVGVLIALWANEWWAERVERAEESEILMAMLVDVRASRVLLANQAEEQKQVLEHLLAVLGGSNGISASLDDSEFTIVVYDALWKAPPLDLQMSAYEEIKGAGRLSLIKSPELRRSLAEYDASIANQRRTRDDLMQHQQSKMDAYAIENFQLVQFAGLLLNQAAKRIPEPDVRINHRALIDEQEFQNLVLTKYSILQIGHERVLKLQSLLERIETLLLQALEIDPSA